MKITNLIVGMMALGTTVSAHASPASQFEGDCAAPVRAMVAAADENLDSNGNPDAEAKAMAAVQVSNVKIVGHIIEQGNPQNRYSVDVEGDTVKGNVIIQATRGGCFIQKVVLKGTRSY